MSEPIESIDDLVRDSCDLARRLLEADAPDSVWKIGMELLQLGMRADGVALEPGVSLWLIWGSLTDAIDHPDANPDPSAAVDTMRRAAQEWLDASPDAEARLAYLDHWRYEECGYERPTER